MLFNGIISVVHTKGVSCIFRCAVREREKEVVLVKKVGDLVYSRAEIIYSLPTHLSTPTAHISPCVILNRLFSTTLADDLPLIC